MNVHITCIAHAACSISFGSVVNAFATVSGMNSQMTKPNVVTIVAQKMVCMSALFTLSWYIEVKHSIANNKSWVDPAYAAVLRKVDGICDSFDAFLSEHKNMPMRVQTVSVRLLMRYTEFCRGLSKAFVLKALGADAEAKAEFKSFSEKFGKKEIEMERYYDHYLACKKVFALIVKPAKKVLQPGTE